MFVNLNILFFPRNRLGFSLNLKNYFFMAEGDLLLSDVGIRNGDLIYAKSDVLVENIGDIRAKEVRELLSYIYIYVFVFLGLGHYWECSTEFRYNCRQIGAGISFDSTGCLCSEQRSFKPEN